ncbi:ubiquinol-cytochrome c reductase iron-sulfur subunit [Methylobacterium oryzihabitans]|uniref:(2Fe-2S)-binding protein n=1 Tax=Methylobacterium oryzihabitans TaxID=2499852 RepID=A0A3S2VAX5_9HYPH|nr:Rieske 2Fe-2S domain-containing protein [Methylobacterium oryzihabitans]RVU18386.1 (2Fe-2S)-binding protein [Methylobacterium oryzihabitans]
MSDETTQAPCPCECAATGWPRRDILTAAIALLMAPTATVLAAGEPGAGAPPARAPNPKALRPQPGDRFAYLSGENKDKPVMAADIKIGDPPRLAYPVDPATETIRSGSRVNQVLLIRTDPSALTPATAPRAAEGIVAYSAICTHNGCPITLLDGDNRSVVCTCHGSRFDLADNGAVLTGPATRRLAGLPVAVADGFVTVAGAFTGALGAATSQ